MKNNMLPPTINLIEQEEKTQGFDLVANVARDKKIDIALSNSFGFGGTNGTLIFKKV